MEHSRTDVRSQNKTILKTEIISRIFSEHKKGMKVETNYMQIRKFTKYVEIKYATEPVCQQKKMKIKYLK